MTKRTTEACGRLLFWCSHFRAYIMPDRCDGERRIGHGEISRRQPRFNGGRYDNVVEPGEGMGDADFDAIVSQRRACLSCPGVCDRSMKELREGKLSL